jgi:serine protease Do
MIVQLLILLTTIAAPIGDAAIVVERQGFERAVSTVMPRVVKLYGLRGGAEAGYGSGIIVSEDGLVLTVLSLLIDARRIRVVTAEGLLLGADVIHRDRNRQLALIQLRPIDDEASREDRHALHSGSQPSSSDRLRLPFFNIAEQAELRPGDWVLAVGNAFKVAEGAEPVSLVHGVFSTRTRLDARRRKRDFRYRDDVLVIDAITSNPGAPGGALVNLDGQFLGMIGREVISNRTNTHFNYAIPRDVLYEYLLEARGIEDGESPGSQPTGVSSNDENGWKNRLSVAGIRMSKVGYKVVLPFVARVRLGSIASRAGLRKDDLILSVNGRNVPDMAAFANTMSFLAPDEPWDLVIRRENRIVSLRIEHATTTDETTPETGGRQ